jgi:hypothetical protein
MPAVALEVQGSHLSVGELDTLGIAFLIQCALHRQAGLVVAAAIRSTTATRLTGGFARPFC